MISQEINKQFKGIESDDEDETTQTKLKMKQKRGSLN